uniref:Uncharacterized protein n=1 Tax=viral metagenome TaxID=1070528 RepID=A0A6C0KL07_9ZZZZ
MSNMDKEAFISCACNGFTKVKEKLQKNSINSADALIEFINYDGENNDHYTELFCLTYILLEKSKEGMNQISPNAYDKLVNHLVDTYASKEI